MNELLSRLKTLPEIRIEVARLAQPLGATSNELPSFGHTRDFAYPHIEVDATHYHYVVVERGQEITRQSTSDFEELLYWIFADTTRSISFAYELKNRVEDQDCRRIAFPKQIELLALVSSSMAKRRAKEIEEILSTAPYNDEKIRTINRIRRQNMT